MWFWILLILAVIAHLFVKLMTPKASSTEAGPMGTLRNHEIDASAVSANSKTSALSIMDSKKKAPEVLPDTAADTVPAGVSAGPEATANTPVATAQTTNMLNTAPNLSVNTGNAGSDVQEMIKILNFAASDAGRLGVTKETFAALRAGIAVSEDNINGIADKLRHMLS